MDGMVEEGMMTRPVSEQRTLENKVGSDNAGVEQGLDNKTKYIPGRVYVDNGKRYGITESGARVELGSSEPAKVRLELAWRGRYEPQQTLDAGVVKSRDEAVKTNEMKERDEVVDETIRNVRDNYSGLEDKAGDVETSKVSKFNAVIGTIGTRGRICSNHKCARKFLREDKGTYCKRCGEKTTHVPYSLNDESFNEWAKEFVDFDSQTGEALTSRGKLKRKAQGVTKVAGVLYDDAAKVTKVVAGDVGRGLVKAGKAGFKAVAYPTVGNLSANLQRRLENLVGKDWYNATRATNVSMITNAFVYTGSAGYGAAYLAYKINFDESLNNPGVLLGSVVGGIYALIEHGSRIKFEKEAFRPADEPRASLIGKLVSLPFELGLGIYDKTKKYIKSVKERAK